MNHSSPPAGHPEQLLKFWISCSLLILATLGAGCHSEQNGYYEGYLQIEKEFPASLDGTGPLAFKGRKWVSLEIKRRGWSGTVEVTDTKQIDAQSGKPQPILEPIEFRPKRNRNLSPRDWGVIELRVPSLNAQFSLKKRKNCLVGSSQSALYQATVCLKIHDDLSLEVTENGKMVLSLNAAEFSRPSLMGQAPNPPGFPLQLRQAIDWALETNPASQVELERRFQARTLALSAALGFAPIANLATGVNIVSAGIANPFGYISAMGALAPFLSSGSWFNFFRARINTKVADISYRMMQANLATLVEGLAYSYRRDVVINYELNLVQERLKHLTEKIQKMISDGKAQGIDYVSSGTEPAILILNAELAEWMLQSPLPTDKSALAQALGIHDVEWLRNLQLGHEVLPIEAAFDASGNPIYLNKNQVVALAVDRSAHSMEILQYQYSIDEAELNQIGRFFQWIDPSGDVTEGLGLKLIGEVQTDASEIRAARFSKMSMIQQIERGAWEVADAYNTALDGYKAAQDNYENRKKLLDDFLSPIERYPWVDGASGQVQRFLAHSELIWMMNDYIKSIVRVKSYHAAFRMARASIDRLLLQGYYSEVDQAIAHSDLLPRRLSLAAGSDCPDDRIIDDTEIAGEADVFKTYRLALDHEPH